MYELNNKCVYKSVWLYSENAVASNGRKIFTFNNLPLIQVKGDKNYIRVASIAFKSTNQSDFTGHVWTVKLGNVKYNHVNYYNSDKNSIPSIFSGMIDSVNMFNCNNNVLEIEPQEINQFYLNVLSDDDHGLNKNSHDIKMYLNLIIEEHYD